MMRATLTALRGQMNPHFVSNCLNSIKHLIQQGKDEEAIEYLIKFSKLHRIMVEQFHDQKVPLSKELEICRYYLEMENLRFKDSFTYQFEIQADEDLISFVEIPPLLLQPFIENAIWHGLLKKKGQKQLDIRIQQEESNLRCIIEDNGIGRKAASKRPKPGSGSKKRKSTGIQNTREKIRIFQELYQVPIDLHIVDKFDDAGQAKGLKVEFLIGFEE